jgi:hypothetical protein
MPGYPLAIVSHLASAGRAHAVSDRLHHAGDLSPVVFYLKKIASA